MGCNSIASKIIIFDLNINHQTFFGLRVFLIKQMVAQRKKDRFAINQLWFLDHMRVTADNQVRPVFDQPFGNISLLLVWPFQQLASPMDRNNHHFGEASCQTQFLPDLNGRDLIFCTVP